MLAQEPMRDMPSKAPQASKAGEEVATFPAPNWTVAHEYYPLVSRTVNRLVARFGWTGEREELHSVGVWGLMQAMQHYEAARAASFAAYARQRIRGAVLDFLRRQDLLTRTSRRRRKELQMAEAALSQRPDRGRDPGAPRN